MGQAPPPAVTLDGSVQLPNGTATEARSYAVVLVNGAGLPAASVASWATARMACCLRLRLIW